MFVVVQVFQGMGLDMETYVVNVEDKNMYGKMNYHPQNILIPGLYEWECF